jgi:molecular chaperone GrpE (heat shock protein)
MAVEGKTSMADKFRIPPPKWPDEQRIVEAVTKQIGAMVAEQGQRGVQETQYAVPQKIIKGMAAIATDAWRAKTRMVDPTSAEVKEEMKRVYRHVEGILEALVTLGIEVKDHTGDTFDYGLPLKVVTTQPTAGITRETVIETIKPTIVWQKQMIQMGEVVIATPISP